MVLRVILDQLAMGRTVTIAPVPQMPDLVNVTITDGVTQVSDSACDADEAAVRHLIRRLAAQLGG